jgi:hypothetical protein
MTMQVAEDVSHVQDELKRARLRKVYIQLRIPRVRAEITSIAMRKKAMNEAGSDASKEVVEERIYNNQHLVALRKELESLEQERKNILGSLRKLKQEEKQKDAS